MVSGYGGWSYEGRGKAVGWSCRRIKDFRAGAGWKPTSWSIGIASRDKLRHGTFLSLPSARSWVQCCFGVLSRQGRRTALRLAQLAAALVGVLVLLPRHSAYSSGELGLR